MRCVILICVLLCLTLPHRTTEQEASSTTTAVPETSQSSDATSTSPAVSETSQSSETTVTSTTPSITQSDIDKLQTQLYIVYGVFGAVCLSLIGCVVYLMIAGRKPRSAPIAAKSQKKGAQNKGIELDEELPEPPGTPYPQNLNSRGLNAENEFSPYQNKRFIPTEDDYPSYQYKRGDDDIFTDRNNYSQYNNKGVRVLPDETPGRRNLAYDKPRGPLPEPVPKRFSRYQGSRGIDPSEELSERGFSAYGGNDKGSNFVY